MRRLLSWRFFILFVALALQGAIGSVAQATGDRVWVNTSSGVYHCPGTRYYGNTKRGEFLEESTAAARGYRPAYGNPCSRAALEEGRRSSIQSLAPAPADTANRVWINTGSHVYHCPGTRYYGNTKRGRFASEAEAIASGNRPAYGSRCN
jgi:hypothetical protein